MAHAQNHKPLATDTILTPAETRIASGYVSGLIGKEIADACDTTMSTQLVRRYPSRRIETRARRGSRRGRREDECDLLGLEI